MKEDHESRGPSYPDKGPGYPKNQLNQAADASRKMRVSELDHALKAYFSEYNTTPDSLEDLVTKRLIKNTQIAVDPQTKEAFRYINGDENHGCKVEVQLSTSDYIYAYCK